MLIIPDSRASSIGQSRRAFGSSASEYSRHPTLSSKEELWRLGIGLAPLLEKIPGVCRTLEVMSLAAFRLFRHVQARWLAALPDIQSEVV